VANAWSRCASAILTVACACPHRNTGTVTEGPTDADAGIFCEIAGA